MTPILQHKKIQVWGNTDPKITSLDDYARILIKESLNDNDTWKLYDELETDIEYDLN
jgi:hypothetical protein